MPPAAATPAREPWTSLWCTALASLVGQLALCQFFSFGQDVPFSIDVNPSNIWKYAYHFPPRGEFLTLNWFGVANLPPTLNPFSFAAAHLPAWLFYTTYAPLIGTAALLAMALFLRELDLPRPAALLGGVVYAWQGDLLPFVLPGHYGYITTWPFFALAAWAALRALRYWAYALIAGASCGMMVGLQPDRGGIASLLIAALYLGPILFRRTTAGPQLRQLALCIVTAVLVSLGGVLALYQGNISGVKLGGETDRDELFALCTQYSLGPMETFTYVAPGLFGWHSSNPSGPYWGWIGQTPGYDLEHKGTRNLNLAISTIGTAAGVLALLGACLLIPQAQRFFGSIAWAPREQAAPSRPTVPLSTFTPRQLDFGRLLLILGGLALVLSWGYHTPLYRPLFALPLMDKWRNPLKWLGIFDFAVVTLGAYGVTQLIRSLTDVTLRRGLSLFFAVVVGFLLLLLGLSFTLLGISIIGFLNAEGYQPVEIGNALHTLHLALGLACLIAALLWLGVIGAWRGDRLQQWDIVNPWLRRLWRHALATENRPAALAVGLAVLVTAQLAWVDLQFISPVSYTSLTADNPLLDSLRSEGPLVRVAVPQPQDSMLNFYLQNQFAFFRLSSIDISAASRIPDNLTTFVDSFAGHTARLWEIGGVKNVAIGQAELVTLRQDADVAANIAAADGYTLAARSDDQPTHALVRLKDYFAKATFIPEAEPFDGDKALLKRLADPKWNPRRSVLLSDDAPGGLSRDKLATAVVAGTPLRDIPNVQVTRYSAHQIDLNLNAPAPGYVLINDAFDPDWQATRNGRPTPLFRADYLLRAVGVEAGPNQITLRYAARYRIAGLAIPSVLAGNFSDACMLAAFLVGAFLIRRKLRDRR